MFYNGLALTVIALGLVMLYFSARVLFHRGWLMAWFRGMAGMVFIAVGLMSALAAFDIYSYRQILLEKSIATISFEILEEQAYSATLVDAEGEERKFKLMGDQWQLDVRIVKWAGVFSKWGIKPAYRLDRLSGRYYSLEKERNGERSVYSLDQSHYGVDIWRWLQNYSPNLKWIDANYGSAAFLPMEDGALYQISLSNTGLVARPLNERAKAAVERWQ